jgi:hypothetical protein
MLPPKYDPNNYTKHGVILIYKRDGYQKLDKLFGSGLLMIKWARMGVNKLSSTSDLNNLVGTIRLKMSTPLGDFEPRDYQLSVGQSQKPFIQFLDIPNPDFEYTLEILNPTGIEKTSIEIWEYNSPQSFLPMPLSKQQPPQDNTSLVAALAANTVAQSSARAEEITDTVTELFGLVQNETTLLKAALDGSRQVSITNQFDAVVRFWTSDVSVVGLNFNSPGWLQELNYVGDSWELPTSLCQSGVYAVAETAGAQVTVAHTFLQGSLPVVGA